MKRTILCVLLLLIAMTPSFAQEKDVTKFLGIPVDGTKAEMIAKLKEKGFTQVDYDEDVILEGQFNGTDVYIFVVANNNKVYRIMVSDKNKRSETDIKIRFNILCNQFNENNKYISLEDYTISEDEDISYQIRVKNKRYQAVFYQANNEFIINELLSKFTKDQLANIDKLSEKDQNDISSIYQKNCSHKAVWFIISEGYGEYGITMYYDNILNQANGDDL